MSLVNWVIAGLVVAALLFAAGFCIDRLGVWAESKGWVYWRKKRASGALSGFLTGMDAVANPGVEYVAVAKDAKKLEEKDSGDGKNPPIIG